MKFKNSKTGEVFDTIGKAIGDYCGTFDCHNCKFWLEDERVDNVAFCAMEFADKIGDSEKLAALIGYEVVRDKPLLCEILGVDANEVFEINGCPGIYYKVRADGTFMKKNCGKWSQCCESLNDSIDAGVKPLPLWTKDDVEDAKAIQRLWTGAERVMYPHGESAGAYRYKISGYKDNREYLLELILPKDGLLKLRQGETVRLDDIISGK